MDFEEILDQAIAILQRRGRLTYRPLKYQFKLDNEGLEVLKEELIKGQRVAIDENGEVVVWAGDSQTTAPASTSQSSQPQPQSPASYIPQHLAERLRPNPLAPWELRIGNLRVFYDIYEEASCVRIVAVGHKRGNKLIIADEEVSI